MKYVYGTTNQCKLGFSVAMYFPLNHRVMEFKILRDFHAQVTNSVARVLLGWW